MIEVVSHAVDVDEITNVAHVVVEYVEDSVNVSQVVVE